VASVHGARWPPLLPPQGVQDHAMGASPWVGGQREERKIGEQSWEPCGGPEYGTCRGAGRRSDDEQWHGEREKVGKG